MKSKTNHFRENQEYYQAQLKADTAYSKRKKRVRRVRFYGACIIATALFAGLYFPYTKQQEDIKQAEENLSELQANLKQLEREAAIKVEQVNLLNDDEYIADLARRDFFMSKDGEVIYSTVKED